MNKGLTITLIVLLLTLVIGLIVGMVLVIKKGIIFSNFSFDSTSKTLIEAKELDNLKDLNIEFNILDIEIKPTEEETITIKLYSDNEKEHKIEETENTINILHKEVEHKINFFQKTPKLVIYLPSSYDKEINIEGDVGDIHLDKLPNTNIKVNLDVGDIKGESINTANIKLKTGDIKIEKINTLIADLQTGDIKSNEINNYLDINLKIGDVKLETVNLNENSKIELKTDDVKIQKTNEIYVETDTRIGDTKVQNNYRKAEIELTIKVDVGDIKVNN